MAFVCGSSESTSGETSTMSAGTIETMCDIVENWLNELLRAGTTLRCTLERHSRDTFVTGAAV